MMATYQLELTPVTPLHIGSGEELPGYSYYLDDFWYVYRIERVLELLPVNERERVVAAATSDIMALGTLLLSYPETLRAAADSIGGYSAGARLRWEDARENRAQALVQRFVHSLDRIYIPGSSLKGALRTALLNAYAKPLRTQYGRRDARRLEADVFEYDERRLNTDPFRLFKVSDTDMLRDFTDLRLLTRYAFKPREGIWEEQVETEAECTRSTLSRLQLSEGEITMRSRLTIQEDAYRTAESDGARPWKFGIGALLDACRHFSGQQLAAEKNYVSGLPAAEGVYQSLAEYAKELPGHATLLRLGSGTGRDSKTANYLQPHPETSRSRLLVDGEYPLGWLELRVLTAEGKPFTEADDLPWQAPALARSGRRTQAAESEHAGAMKKQKAEEERGKKTALDVMAFLNRQEDADADDE